MDNHSVYRGLVLLEMGSHKLDSLRAGNCCVISFILGFSLGIHLLILPSNLLNDYGTSRHPICDLHNPPRPRFSIGSDLSIRLIASIYRR